MGWVQLPEGADAEELAFGTHAEEGDVRRQQSVDIECMDMTRGRVFVSELQVSSEQRSDIVNPRAAFCDGLGSHMPMYQAFPVFRLRGFPNAAH